MPPLTLTVYFVFKLFLLPSLFFYSIQVLVQVVLNVFNAQLGDTKTKQMQLVVMCVLWVTIKVKRNGQIVQFVLQESFRLAKRAVARCVQGVTFKKITQHKVVMVVQLDILRI